MLLPTKLAKAQFRQIKWTKVKRSKKPIVEEIGKAKEVQFNPETLTVSYSNQKSKAGRFKNVSAMQYVGKGTTKLSMDLWFDATVSEKVDDVRKLTEQVKFFMKPEEKTVRRRTRRRTPSRVPKPQGDRGATSTAAKSKKPRKKSRRKVKHIIPGLRFVWGTFIFDGVMDSLNEKLEYFSEDGKPLRAMLSITISSQDIQFKREGQKKSAKTGKIAPGTQPQAVARAGGTVQEMAEEAGWGDDWQTIAMANGIENPRQLAPGTPIEMDFDFDVDINAGFIKEKRIWPSLSVNLK